MDEFKLINKYFHPLTNKCEESQNLSDDVAILPKSNLVISKDIIVEDIHFKLSHGAYNIANRLIRSNLSDIASSGTKPKYYMLGFCKNDQVNEDFIKDFTLALKQINDEFNISLIGGDTVKSKDKLFFSITIFGEVENNILSRKNAKEKDLIFTSGNIGDAFLGLKILEKELKANKENKEYLISKYHKPTPRIDLGQNLTKENLSKCAIDISDGLLADLRQICKSSNLSASIFEEKIPISTPAKEILKENKNLSKQDLACGGDDYELIFTVNELNVNKLEKLSKKLNLKLTNIGYFSKLESKNNYIKLLKNNKEVKINKFGYEH